MLFETISSVILPSTISIHSCIIARFVSSPSAKSNISICFLVSPSTEDAVGETGGGGGTEPAEDAVGGTGSTGVATGGCSTSAITEVACLLDRVKTSIPSGEC